MESCAVNDMLARLWLALKDVEDPEIPVSIVDMGLVVSLEYLDRVAKLRITYTAMGCPAMDMIQDDIRRRLLQEADVDAVEIKVTWDPVWTRKRLSDTAKAAMQELGIAV
jgi:metal-sulfur cluster biosynthetic enzyme